MVKPRPRGSRGAAPPSSTAALASKAAEQGDAGIFRAAVADVKRLAPTGRADSSAGSVAAKSRARRVSAARQEAGPAQALDLLPDTIAPEDVVGGSEALSYRRSACATR